MALNHRRTGYRCRWLLRSRQDSHCMQWRDCLAAVLPDRLRRCRLCRHSLQGTAHTLHRSRLAVTQHRSDRTCHLCQSRQAGTERRQWHRCSVKCRLHMWSMCRLSQPSRQRRLHTTCGPCAALCLPNSARSSHWKARLERTLLQPSRMQRKPSCLHSVEWQRHTRCTADHRR